MAGSARSRKVRAHECKPGDAMVEGCRIPTCRGVAVGAIADNKGRTGRRMHRIVGSLPGSQVALRISAAVEGDLQAEVAVDVAEAASNGGVLPGERETGDAVVERGRIPACGGMAVRAIR